ncbi:hypothetical protein ABBQ32_013246 [Trebouxia sp. C0010 RCD-2024]
MMSEKMAPFGAAVLKGRFQSAFGEVSQAVQKGLSAVRQRFARAVICDFDARNDDLMLAERCIETIGRRPKSDVSRTAEL